jgi:predicted DNA-binding transcriptional regulator AlpA
MSLETASHFLSVSETEFLQLATASGLKEVEVVDGIFRWRASDIDRVVAKLPARAKAIPSLRDHRAEAPVPTDPIDRPSAAPPLPTLVSIARAVEHMAISRTTIHRLMRDGELEIVKIGKRTLITGASIKALTTPISSTRRRDPERGGLRS